MSTSKEIKYGILGTYVIFIANILASLLFTPFLVHSLGKAEYGIYSLMGAFIASFTILDFGFGNAITRYVAQYEAEGAKEKEASFLGMCISMYSIIAVISIIIGIIIYFFLDRIYGNFTDHEMHTAKVIYILLIFNLFISFFIGAFNAYIQGREKFRIINVILFVRLFLRIAILLMLLSLGFKSITVVIVDTLLNLITGLFYFFYAKNKLNMKIRFLNFNITLLKEITKYSSFVFIANIADMFMWRVGLLVIGAYKGPEGVAVYSIGLTLVSYFQYISGVINGKLFPKVTHLVTNNSSSKILSTFINKVARIQLIILGGMLIGFSLLGRDFIYLWLGSDYSDAYFIGLVLMAVMMAQSLQYTCVLVLRAKKKDGFRSILQLITMIIGALIGSMLITKFDIIGMAAGMAIAIFALNWLFINLHYIKQFNFQLLAYLKELSNLFPSLLLATIIGIFITFIPGDSWFNFFLKSSLFLIQFIIIIWLIGANMSEKKIIISLIKGVTFKFRTISKIS